MIRLTEVVPKRHPEKAYFVGIVWVKENQSKIQKCNDEKFGICRERLEDTISGNIQIWSQHGAVYLLPFPTIRNCPSPLLKPKSPPIHNVRQWNPRYRSRYILRIESIRIFSKLGLTLQKVPSFALEVLNAHQTQPGLSQWSTSHEIALGLVSAK